MAVPDKPNILYPYAVESFSTSIADQRIGGFAGLGTVRVLVSQFPDLTVNLNPETLEYYFDVVLTAGNNTFTVFGENVDGRSTPSSIEILLTTEDQLSVLVDQPTGVVLSSGSDTLLIEWPEVEVSGITGYNVWRSTDSAGGQGGYLLLTERPISTESRVEKERVLVSSDTEVVSGIEVETFRYSVVNRKVFSYSDSRRRSDGTVDVAVVYYVITAVRFDALVREEIESVYSAEVSGSVLPLSQSIVAMKRPLQREVVTRLVTSVLQVEKKMDVKTGTVARDLLDPAAEQFEDAYVVLDFMNRSQSFPTLLEIDDPESTGVSQSVSDSSYKQSLKKALGYTDDTDVQNVVDGAFDKLAAVFFVSRIGALPAETSVVFYTTSAPQEDLTVVVGDRVSTVADSESGVAEVRFKALSTVVLPVAQADQFYNYVRNRWEIVVPVQAEVGGAFTNVPSGTITSVLTGAIGFRVTNLSASELGSDRETNNALATRATLGIVGLDSGTKSGYLKTVLGILGVRKAELIYAGSIQMIRDWDTARNQHVGGKVDVWVQTDGLEEVTDVVPFKYVHGEERQAVISSVPLMYFQVVDAVFDDAGNSIYEVTQVYNETRRASYDLTGAVVIPPNAVSLDAGSAYNLRVGLASTDSVKVTYNRRSLSVYQLSHQPLYDIVSVMGDLSGDLNDNYNVYRNRDPLILGRSIRAGDSVEVFFNPSLNTPLDQTASTVDEQLVLVGVIGQPLSKVGVELSTIELWNVGKTKKYVAGADFDVFVDGYVCYVVRIATGSIPNGSVSLVSYKSGENIQITYRVWGGVGRVTDDVTAMQHLTADVVVKQAVQVAVDIDMVVGLRGGTDRGSVDAKIRTVLASAFSAKKLGESMYQSDVIGLVEGIRGVDFVSVPFSKMVRADNSEIVGEILDISSDPLDPNGWELVGGVEAQVWVTKRSVLSFPTVDGGGLTYTIEGRPNKMYRWVAIYKDAVSMAAQELERDVTGGAERCFIRSDGKVVISLGSGDAPGSHVYRASYFCVGDSGAKDIVASSLEYLVLGSLVVVYQEGGRVIR